MKRFPKLVVWFFFFSVIILAFEPANALVLYEQSPIASLGVTSSQDYRKADNFSFTADAVVMDLHWWGNYGSDTPNPTDNFFIDFYYDNGSGLPEETPFTTVTPVGMTRELSGMYTPGGDFPFPIYQYDAFLSMPVPLSGGTTYYLSIYNFLGPGDVSWGWTQSSIIDGSYTKWPLDDPWRWMGSYEMAFSLTSDPSSPIPEPSTILLIGTGLVGFTIPAIRRKFKN